MKISNGTTDVEFVTNRLVDFTAMEKSTGRTSGGNITQLIVGHRFTGLEKIRSTGAEYKTLIDLLVDGSTSYFYTPTTAPTYVASTKFPMEVSVGVPTRVTKYGAGNIYVFELTIEGIEYL